MKKLLKRITFSLILSALFLTSCFNDNVENRTQEQELKELNELIQVLHTEGYDVDTTQLGVYYIIHKAGEGPLAKIGDTVSINYEGYLTDGSMFDASADWAPGGIWEFVYGDQNLIPGFNEAISYMNKNQESEFIIPSSLAYGAYGSGAIGPFQTLIFAVKMVDLKPE